MGSDDALVILKALKFSANKHRNQRRKDEQGSPYINHPIDVAETLMRVGDVRDLETIVAAILHDTIEDTNTRPEEISEAFGKDVLALVLEVTDDKALPKAVRKQLQVENAPHKSPKAKLIKIADKISNIHDVTHSPPADWSFERREEYLDWAERVIAGLRGCNRPLEDFFDTLIHQARKKLKAERSSLTQP